MAGHPCVHVPVLYPARTEILLSASSCGCHTQDIPAVGTRAAEHRRGSERDGTAREPPPPPHPSGPSPCRLPRQGWDRDLDGLAIRGRQIGAPRAVSVPRVLVTGRDGVGAGPLAIEGRWPALPVRAGAISSAAGFARLGRSRPRGPAHRMERGESGPSRAEAARPTAAAGYVVEGRSFRFNASAPKSQAMCIVRPVRRASRRPQEE